MTDTSTNAITGLTVTEAETLAIILHSAEKSISRTHTADGNWAWPGDTISDVVSDMCDGFYAIMNTAVAAGADRGLFGVFI